MTDTRTQEQRRRIMQAVGVRNTAPELVVRRLLHAQGVRFRLHRKDLPGTPDIVFPKFHKVIFVHGCFWHGHDCRKGRLPKSRTEYWIPKIAANRQRDRIASDRLRMSGWEAMTVWQCELNDCASLVDRMQEFLGISPRNRSTFTAHTLECSATHEKDSATKRKRSRPTAGGGRTVRRSRRDQSRI